MNHTQSASRLSTEPLEQPRGASAAPRRTEGPPVPPAAPGGGLPQPHVLRLHAPPADRRPHALASVATPTAPCGAADRAAEDIVDGVLKAAHRLRGLLSGHFSEFDLTDVRFAVLRFLRDAEPHGCTQSEIALHLDQSESSISTLVKRMRKSELLFRLRSGIDKRKWVLKLTNRGSSLLETARRCHADRMDGFLRAFDSDERLNLTGMLNKLVAELTPQDAPSASRAQGPADGESAALSDSATIASPLDVAGDAALDGRAASHASRDAALDGHAASHPSRDAALDGHAASHPSRDAALDGHAASHPSRDAANPAAGEAPAA